MRALVSGIAVSLLCALACGGAAQAGNPLVDPTRPATATDVPAEASEAGGVRVQAVVIRGGSRVAVVDGRVVRAGDRIANVLIEEVTPDGVRYSQDGHSRFARLKCPTPLSVRHGGAPSQRDSP
jgi:MSHA biogenesis protein MshK